MRKIYQKYFEVPEENKGIMGERVFFARLTVAIACIVLCMSAMGFSAYAFFTASVSSSMNQIQAASFTVRPEITVVANSEGSAAHEKDTTWKYILQPGTYNITLNKEGSASTGYCLIKIGDNAFYTQQLGTVKDESGNEIVTRTIAIVIAVDEAITIEITACWGTYSGDPLPIFETEEIIIVDENGVAASKESEPMQETTTSTENTTSTEAATSTDTTTPAGATTPTETTNTPENAVTPTEEKKDESASSETEGDTTKSTESTDDVTPSTNSTE